MIYDMHIGRDGKIQVAINGRIQGEFETVIAAREWLDAGAPGAKLLTPESIMLFATMAAIIAPAIWMAIFY